MNLENKIGISLVLLALSLIASSFPVDAYTMQLCNRPNEGCNQYYQCCPTGINEYGYFYEYCENGLCRAADGINGKTPNQFCRDYLLYANGQFKSTAYHYLPESLCPEVSPTCVAQCQTERDECEDVLCADKCYPPGNPSNPTACESCIGVCDDTFVNCYNNCPGSESTCLHHGQDYLGWDPEEIQGIMSSPPPGVTHACDLIFPEYVGGLPKATPDGSSFQYRYSDWGELIEVTDPYKTVEKTYYSSTMRPGLAYATFSADSGIDNPATVSTDGLGMPLDSTTPNGDLVMNYYDGHERMIKSEVYCVSQDPDRSWCFNNQMFNDKYIYPYETVEYCYDYYKDGDDPCGDPFLYDGGEESCGLGNLCEIVQKVRNEDNQEVYDPVTNTKLYYDIANRVIKETKIIYDPVNGDRVYNQEYRYDQAGNVLIYRAPDGNEIEYEYNKLNQIVGARMYRNLLENPGFEEGSNYWNFANVQASYTESHSSSRYSKRGDGWGPNQNVLSKVEEGKSYSIGVWAKKLSTDPTLKVRFQGQYTDGSWTPYFTSCDFTLTNEWAYYECDLNIPVDFDDSKTLSYLNVYFAWGDSWPSDRQAAFDDASLFENGASASVRFEYNPTGTVATKQLGDNIYTSYTYTVKDFLETMYVSSGEDDSGTKLFARTYGYDNVGNIKDISYDVDLNNRGTMGTVHESFDYDRLNRLTQAEYQNQLPGLDKTFGYDHDLVGNRLWENINGVQTNYDYDAVGTAEGPATESNRLLGIGTSSPWDFDYDTNGNIIFMDKPDLGTVEFIFDPLDRLVKVMVDHGENNIVTDKYVYDYAGQRIKKIENAGSENEVVTYYVYQGNNVVFEEKLSALEYVCGDTDGSGGVDIDDVVYNIAYIFTGGPLPACTPVETCGDADMSGSIDIDDVVYTIAYIFTGGPTPCHPDAQFAYPDTDGWGLTEVQDYMTQIQETGTYTPSAEEPVTKQPAPITKTPSR